jgi:hypothetical protein
MPVTDDEAKQNSVIAQIVELQREFYFENKNKETERRRRLREIIEQATPLKGER